jgi:hypothetical protein
MVATLLALALIASMGWYVWNSVRVLHAVQDRTFRLLALTGRVSYLNEAVWASARLRMSTGEARWLDRYGSMMSRRNDALPVPNPCAGPIQQRGAITLRR